MFIDSHCHLNFKCFNDDIMAILAQLKEKKINKLIIPSTHAKEWASIQHMAQTHDVIYYALGVHTQFLHSYKESDLKYLQTLLEKKPKKCVALGEIGLDKGVSFSAEEQEILFIKQLQLAEKFQLPIILHCVKKQGRVLEILKACHFSQGGVYHGFSASVEVGNEFIKLGFKLGIGGVITHPNAIKVRASIAHLPLTSLLLETDAPDMHLHQQSQKNNTPLNVIPIFECLNNLRNEEKSCISTQLYKNTLAIFPLIGD
ncbi:TatD family hydrolase [Psychromonas sp. CD1]|uniref:TatD family hydrolase n=1 Tax=Psychromonas sp. CD1 TaxID=1979839 RepID=UPI000B9C120F|nr:TatD family hydrolase [Psychromonas sp. CD1]